MDALLEADVDVSDIEQEEELVTVFAPNTEYAKAKAALSQAFGEINYEVDEIQFIPQTSISIAAEEDQALFDKLMDMLNDVDDVQNIYHNVDQ